MQQMAMPPPGLNRPFPQHLAPHFAQLGISMDQAMNYWSTFNMFDIDGSGTINISEMATGLQLMGQLPSPAEIQNMMMQADNNQDGQVDFLEYVRVTHGCSKPQQAVQNDLEAAFRVFDRDNSGSLDAGELQAVLCHKGMPKADFDRVMSLIDLDGDGRVNYCEFARLMTQPLPAFAAARHGKHNSHDKHDKHDKHKHGKGKKKHKKSKKSKKKHGSDYSGSDYSGSDYSGSDYSD